MTKPNIVISEKLHIWKKNPHTQYPPNKDNNYLKTYNIHLFTNLNVSPILSLKYMLQSLSRYTRSPKEKNRSPFLNTSLTNFFSFISLGPLQKPVYSCSLTEDITRPTSPETDVSIVTCTDTILSRPQGFYHTGRRIFGSYPTRRKKVTKFSFYKYTICR